jgi:subtilisin-like proprotein convertase family protein
MRRILVLLATMVTAVLVVSGVALAAPPGETSTDFVSNSAKITIPSASQASFEGPADPYPSTITVTDSDFPEGSRITDLNVHLNTFTHTFPDDVDVLLVGPGPTPESAILMSDAGGFQAVGSLTLVIDNQGQERLLNDGPLLSNCLCEFKPANYRPSDSFPSVVLAGNPGKSLSVFNRTEPFGTWELYVVDDTGGDAGAFADGWGLEFTVRVPAG